MPRRLHPSAIVALGFLGVIVLATLVLMLPISRADPSAPPDLMVALFTATSAVCVTGLTLVDTGTYWSTFGHVALLVMFQIGGFGMMVTATLLGLWAAKSLQLRTRMLLQAETHALTLGDVKGVFRIAWMSTLAIEVIAATWMTLRFALGYGKDWGEAAWLGVFHAISAFNNAGFSVFAANMAEFSRDVWVLFPIMACVVIGGLGFPVLYEVFTRLRTRGVLPRMSMHAQMTMIGTALLLLIGTVGIAMVEWHNPKTLGPMPFAEKWLNALFTSVVSRTAGFNSIDLSALNTNSYVLHYFLMFVGGGSSGTASGIKITTLGVLLVAVWSEVRGYPDAEFRGRRIAPTVLRQALSVIVLGSGVVAAAMLAIVPMTDLPYEHVMFEVVSAFGTVGVSAGITAKLPPAAQLILVLLMFIGRVGIVTLAMSMAAKPYRASYRYPEERPIVG